MVHYNQNRPSSVQSFHDSSSVPRSISASYMTGNGSGMHTPNLSSPFKNSLGASDR